MLTAELPKLMTLPEVADQTGISLRVLEDGCRARRWKHYHIGSKRFMDAEQVALLLQQHTLEPPAEDDDLAATRARVARRAERRARSDRPAVAR